MINTDANNAKEYIRTLYRGVLHREPDAEGFNNWLHQLNSGAMQPYEIFECFLASDEKKMLASKLAGANYHVPDELMITSYPINRVLCIGSCLIESWINIIAHVGGGTVCDHILYNNVAELPEQPPVPIDEYNFQVIQIPLRSVLPETAFWGLDYTTEEPFQALFAETKQRVIYFLQAALRWNVQYGLLTFVCNFLTPQQNPMGRLFPRHDYRNMLYFIEQLNVFLSRELCSYQQVYFLDINQISFIHGQKNARDDVLWLSVHSSILSDWDYQFDQDRVQPIQPASYSFIIRQKEYIEAIWLELVAMYRSIRQADAIKLVVFDLDNTLWRGVVAESEQKGYLTLEGWPLGLIEAIHVLKKRGILLAIISKNDEQHIRMLWPEIMGGLIDLDSFASIKINWNSKVNNMQEILHELNLLPANVLFIDDNHVERAHIRNSFPEVRLLGDNPYLIRRVLLWSPELQVAQLTKESARRTEMVQAQMQRARDHQKLSRSEFLSSLNIQITQNKIHATNHQRFSRVLELLNKTNQFNTTGQRWTHEQCVAHFSSGGVIYFFDVADKYSNYGLVVVVILAHSSIKQMVMSCRVIGLDIELAVINSICHELWNDGYVDVDAEFVETKTNLPARNLYKQCGFIAHGTIWRKQLHEHIAEHIPVCREI